MNAVRLPRIKVCGLTRVADLRAAIAAGADAVGFVHYPPSPRHVDAESCAQLARAARGAAFSVLVTVDLEPAALEVLIAEVRPDAVQLCGGEAPEDCSGLQAAVLRRLPVQAGSEQQVDAWKTRALGFVLDHPATPGGSGRQVDLERSARLAASAPCLLAGGLGPDSVAAAIAAVRPHGVDASSRLETAPGIKDPVRVEAFIEHALRALQTAPS